MSLGTSILLAVIAGAAYLMRRIGGDSQFERPIVLGPIVGAILGDITTGIKVGGTLELIFIGAASFGGVAPPNTVMATVLGVAFGIQSGHGVQGALVVAVPAGIVATSFELIAKSGCAFLVHQADREAEKPSDRGMLRVVWTGNTIHFLAYAVPAFLGLYFGQSAVQSITDAINGSVSDALSTAAGILPAVGFGILLSMLATRRLFPLFFIGFALAAYTDFTVIGVALIGVCALLYSQRSTGTSAPAPATGPADATPVMAGGAPIDLQPQRDIRRLFWRSFLLQAAFNYERFQNIGWWWTIKPFLQRFYPDPQERSAAYRRHLAFFNTNPWTAGPILGVATTMEARRAAGETGIDDETINSVKVSMMGPLAGIGDSLLFGALRPVLAGTCGALAVSGNLLGSIIFFLGMNVVQVILRWYGVSIGYRYGERFFERIDPVRIERLKSAATTLGLLVVGALAATLVSLTTPLDYKKGDASVKVQDALDQLLPALLPLAATMLVFWLIRRRMGSTWVLALVAVIGLVGGYFGVLASS